MTFDVVVTCALKRPRDRVQATTLSLSISTYLAYRPGCRWVGPGPVGLGKTILPMIAAALIQSILATYRP